MSDSKRNNNARPHVKQRAARDASLEARGRQRSSQRTAREHAQLAAEHSAEMERERVRHQRAVAERQKQATSANRVHVSDVGGVTHAVSDRHQRANAGNTGSNPRIDTSYAKRAHTGSFTPAVREERAGSYTVEGKGLGFARAGKRAPKAAIVALAVVLVAILGFVMYQTSFAPVPVVVNGVEMSVARTDTYDQVVQKSGIQVTPGRLLAVDGSVIDDAGGAPYALAVNGQNVDANARITPNDVISVSDGGDTTEDYTESTQTVAAEWVDDGSKGAVHQVVSQPADGVVATRTGSISGITVEGVTVQEVQNAVLSRYSINTGGEKVIALTFDDGPWDEWTSEILDILDANDAKATFFIVGERIGEASNGRDLIMREYDSGHQLCTHTFDHAKGSGKGVNISYMSAEEQIAEIEKGRQAISDVTGVEASRVVRCPGGNYTLESAQILNEYVTYDIGWNIDTRDWSKPGAPAIEDAILSADSGNIILMHDGGGDRSQTVEALRSALPKLKQQGYRFVTIDELLSYHKG